MSEEKRLAADELKVLKILNNSTILAADRDGAECIVFGKGIGFGKSKGDAIDPDTVSKRFSYHDPEGENLYRLIQQIPKPCLEVSQEIIEYAENILGQELNRSLYLTLPDHIAFVAERAKNGHLPANPLKWEIRRYYPVEYQIAQKAVELLQEEFGIELPDDETASIAMHLVNAETELHLHESIAMLELMNGILQIIRYQTGVHLAEDDLDYQRLITHLKFFVQRIAAKSQYAGDLDLFALVTNSYPQAYQVVCQVREYVAIKTSYAVSADELTYLTIHIQRLLSKKQ